VVDRLHIHTLVFVYLKGKLGLIVTKAGPHYPLKFRVKKTPNFLSSFMNCFVSLLSYCWCFSEKPRLFTGRTTKWKSCTNYKVKK